MIDCVEAFDAAAAAAAARTVQANIRSLDNHSSRSWDKTATAYAAAAPRAEAWKEDAATVPSNALTSLSAPVAAYLFSSDGGSARAARSSSAAAADGTGYKMMPGFSVEARGEEPTSQQRTKDWGGEAAGGDIPAGCDFLSHPVYNVPAGKPDAGTSTTTPSVFSPCPSEAGSPVLEAACCFSAGDSVVEDATSAWDAATSTTGSNTQSTGRNGSKTERKSSSSNSEHCRAKPKAKDARPAVASSSSSFGAASDLPAATSQHLSGRTPPAAEFCYFQSGGAALGLQPVAAQDCWQQLPPFRQQTAAAGRGLTAAGADAAPPVVSDEAFSGCCSTTPCWWDGPAPLEGGRTAATRDYYLGDETCVPSAESSSSSSPAAPLAQQEQRQEFEEADQVQGETLEEIEAQHRLETQQKAEEQQLLLAKTQHLEAHRGALKTWECENELPAGEEKAAAGEQEDVGHSGALLQIRTIATEEEDDEEEEKGGPPLLLFPFLRKAKVLKIAINEVLLLQQQTGYLLLLQPPSSPTAVPAAFCSSCNGGSSALERTLLFESTKAHVEAADAESAAAAFLAAAGAGGEGGTTSLCYTCELALHVNTAQQLLTRTHRALQQLLLQQEEEEARWHEEQQQQQHTSMTLFLEQMQQQHNTAASAAELRIRRSVLRQQQHQLQVALEQQQQLEDDLKARWEAEVLADMQILCPDRPQGELQQRLSQQLLATEEQQGSAAAAAWLLVESSNCSATPSGVSAAAVGADSSTSTTAATTGCGGLQAAEVVAAKCRQLQKLQASLLEVRSMMEQMQQLQLGRDEQIGCIEEAATITKENTNDAVRDLLLARKYQRRAFRHSLYFVGALAALFLFFFFPASPLMPLLFLFHGEKPPPPNSP